LCVARWRSARGIIGWLCNQELWYSKVAIVLCAAVRYRRATVGRSRDDAHPYTSTLHKGLFAPTPALWKAPSSHRPVQAMAVHKCSKSYQLFLVFRGRALFVRGKIHP
jgi:hypothetical protein